jgi:hypothetical protein
MLHSVHCFFRLLFISHLASASSPLLAVYQESKTLHQSISPAAPQRTHDSRNEDSQEKWNDGRKKKPYKSLRQRTKEVKERTKKKRKRKKTYTKTKWCGRDFTDLWGRGCCIAPLLVTGEWCLWLWWKKKLKWKCETQKLWSVEVGIFLRYFFFLVFNEYEELFFLFFFFKKKNVSFEVWLVCRCWSLEEQKKEEDKRFFTIFGHCFSTILVLILWLLSTR